MGKNCAVTLERSIRKTLVLGVSCFILGSPLPLQAQTLEQALSQAYVDNPELSAARLNLRKINEGVPRAKAGWRPTVRSSLSLGSSYSETETSGVTTDSTTVPGNLSVSIRQPIYTGGTTEASIRKAKSTVQAERSRLSSAEQKLMLDGATAYVDVISARSVVELQTNNLKRIEKQLEATKERFRVGEVTRTDVAQSEARADREKADKIKLKETLIHPLQYMKKSLEKYQVSFSTPLNLMDYLVILKKRLK